MTSLPPLDAWRPLPVEQLMRIFEPLGVPWWVAGGIAIDLHVGRETRDHGDIDVAMLRNHHARLTGVLDEFNLYIAYDGTLTPWHGGTLGEEHHQFWARRSGDDAWAFEVLLEHSDGGDWQYRRDPRVRCPLAELGLHDASGVPYVRPSIALLYKSNRPELDRNARDFDIALPVLSAPERAWLRSALRITAPAHPWLARLGG